MPIKIKYYLGLIIFILLMIFWSWCIIKFSNKFLIPLLITFFGMGIFSMSLKCPKCGKNVLLDQYNIFGENIEIANRWVYDKCINCGYKLN